MTYFPPRSYALVFTDDNGVYDYTTDRLQNLLQREAHGEDVGQFTAYAVVDGRLETVSIRQNQGAFDEDDVAVVRVKVVPVCPGPVVDEFTYTIDGRA